MEKNKLISHEEIADLRYYFLDSDQMEQFLQVINDEFALRVGEAITSSLPRYKLMEMVSLPEGEIQDFINRTLPGFEETVTRIRKYLIDELREERRSVLLGTESYPSIYEDWGN